MLLVGSGLLAGWPDAVEGQVSDRAVREAIEKGLDYLRERQGEEGHWEEHAEIHGRKQDGGTSALVTYAMLTAGEDWQLPHMREALGYLRELETEGTYARGFRAHVWAQLPDPFLDALQEDAYWLTNAMFESDGYGYYGRSRESENRHPTSLSRTQYAVLGVWEAAKRGVDVGRGYWGSVESMMLANQNSDGGWGYGIVDSMPSNGAMTTAGLALLHITRDYLHRSEYTNVNAGNRRHDQAIGKGMDWLDERFRSDRNVGDSNIPLGAEVNYYRVGIERVALASGRKYLNGEEWYLAIAKDLLEEQRGDGSFKDGRSGPVVDTAFALILLARGRVPVVMNKLRIDGYSWNNRPSDLANLTSWLSDEYERSLIWQVVPVDKPVEEWMDSPLLYLASHEPLPFEGASDERLQRIKRFIDLGGTLVIAPDAGDRRFLRSVEETFGELYPHPLKPVADDDPLNTVVYQTPRSQLQSIHNGARHLVIVLPAGSTATLQTATRQQGPIWHALANIFQYANNRQRPRAKLERLAAWTDEQPSAANRSHAVARVTYDGAWDPEPLAYERLSHGLRDLARIEVTGESVEMANMETDAPLAHLAGAGSADFTDQQVEALRGYVQGGGTVLLEAVGGDPDFADALTGLVREAFPDARPEPLAANHPLLTGAGLANGFDCREPRFTAYFRQTFNPPNRPFFQAIMIDDRPAVILSHEDLSHAWLGQPVWGVIGYEAIYARQFMANLLQYTAGD